MPADYSDVAVRTTQRAYPRYDYENTTSVFMRGNSDTFHADKRCPNLLMHADEDYADLGDREKVVCMDERPLPEILSTWLDPVKACTYCTLSMMEAARVAVQQDGMSARMLKIFERGERRVHTHVRRTPSGETTVSESAEVIE